MLAYYGCLSFKCQLAQYIKDIKPDNLIKDHLKEVSLIPLFYCYKRTSHSEKPVD